MAVYLTEVVTDLAMPPQQRPIPHQFAMGDNNAYTITALLCDSRNPEAELMDGTVGGELVRPDGVTVALEGEKGDAVRQVNLAAGGLCNATPCSVTLPQACFAYPGRVTLTIKLTDGTTITQALSMSAVVVRTSTDVVVDPGDVVPDIGSLQAAAAEATAAAADARAAASSAVRYDTAQSLTDAQKEQARKNIGTARQDAVAIISRGHGENLIALTDFTEVYGSGTTYAVDTENQTVTVTSTSGSYRCLQTPVNWVQNHLTPGHTYRLHAKAAKVSGSPEAKASFRGGENGADSINRGASVIYPDPNNGGDAFVDYTVDRFTRRITLFVSFGRANAASVVFSDIWLVDVTDARNLAPVDTTTATATHASGSLLTVSGQLYKATQAIATGETITPGTNVSPTTVAAQLAERDTAIAAETAARETAIEELPMSASAYFAGLLGANGSNTMNGKRITVAGNRVRLEGVSTSGNSTYAMFNVLGNVGSVNGTYSETNAKNLFAQGACFTNNTERPIFAQNSAAILRVAFVKRSERATPQEWEWGYGLYTYNADTDTLTQGYHGYWQAGANGMLIVDRPLSAEFIQAVIDNGTLSLVIYGKGNSQYIGNSIDLCWEIIPVAPTT